MDLSFFSYLELPVFGILFQNFCVNHVLQGFLQTEIVVTRVMDMPAYLEAMEMVGFNLPTFGTASPYLCIGYCLLRDEDESLGPEDILYTFDNEGMDFRQGEVVFYVLFESVHVGVLMMMQWFSATGRHK